MAEPFSIAVGVLSVLSTVTKLSIQFPQFVSAVRGAKDDITGVRGELEAISVSLAKLKESERHIPEIFHKNIEELLSGCNVVLEGIYNQLRVIQASRAQSWRWTITGRSELVRRKSSLEGYKSALSLLLLTCGLYILLSRRCRRCSGPFPC